MHAPVHRHTYTSILKNKFTVDYLIEDSAGQDAACKKLSSPVRTQSRRLRNEKWRRWDPEASRSRLTVSRYKDNMSHKGAYYVLIIGRLVKMMNLYALSWNTWFYEASTSRK